jgi:hypothetical protein
VNGAGEQCQHSLEAARNTYPALPAVPVALAPVPSAALAMLIQHTGFAVATEESRYSALLVLKPEWLYGGQ